MAVLISFIVCIYIAATSLFGVEAEEQSPLMLKDGKVDLIYELKKAEIIPTVLDAFAPLLEVSIDWQNATADYGNTINPHKTKHQPDVELVNVDSALWPDVKSTPQLTLAMTDPDAPSRDNPEWSEICHWIVTNVKLIKSSQDSDDASDDVDPLKKRMLDVMPYKPPGPPPETGKHRYVYVALVPKNGTTDTLHLKRPDDRQHWGYEHERQGLRMWAEEMGLKVVGANFIYAQNDEQ